MKRTSFGLAIVLAIFSAAANAAAQCEGLIQRALLYADGTVSVLSTWRGDYTVICNTNGTWGSVPAEVCLSWYATALKAAADGKQVAIYYGSTSSTCATLPTYWSAPVPTYVGVRQ